MALYSGCFRREGAPRRDHATNRQSYIPVAININFVCMVMVVSDGFRSTLIWFKFKNFPGQACPRPPYNALRYIRARKKLRAPHGRTKLTLCMPPPPSSMSRSAPGRGIVAGSSKTIAIILRVSSVLSTAPRSCRLTDARLGAETVGIY